MIVKEAGSPSDAPLPHLTGKQAATEPKKPHEKVGVTENTIILLIGFFLVLMTFPHIPFIARNFRNFGNGVYMFPHPVFIVFMLVLGIYLIARSVQGYVTWFQQRKENAA